jgi:peptidoglycan/xylan/chitin deacetylase (PgdA/CDA1 family)
VPGIALTGLREQKPLEQTSVNAAEPSVILPEAVPKSTASTTQAPSRHEIPYSAAGEEHSPKRSNAPGFHEAPNGQGKYVALTFDDGPSGKVTKNILDLLEKYDAKATFFALGNRAQGYQALLQRMTAMGCEVASHSFAHKHLVKLSTAQLVKDLTKASDALEKASGQRPVLLRPPYGERNVCIESNAKMPLILWSIDTKDWYYRDKEKDTRSAAQRQKDLERVANEVLDTVRNGDIVLMHDLYDMTEQAAAVILKELTEKGWNLVTVSELFRIHGITLENGKIYRSARGV